MKKTCCMLISIFMVTSLLFSGCPLLDFEREEEEISFPDFEAIIEDHFTGSELHITPSEPAPEVDFPEFTEPTEPEITVPLETELEITEPEEPEPEESVPSYTSSEIQAFIDAKRQEYGAVGIQVAVVDNGKIVGTYGSGWATMDSDPMTADHKIRVASISKIIIGIVAMQLKEDGIIGMDSDIGPIWGVTARSPSYPNTPITIDYLLTHTSTITDYGNQSDMDYDTVKSRLDTGFTGAQPGNIGNYNYNNYAFRLLGMTLELASGKTLDQYLHERLFADLNIDASFASGDIQNTEKLATLYWEGHGVARSHSYQMDIHGPASPGGDGFHYSGGLTISAADLAKILTMLVNDGIYQGKRLLSAESVSQMEEYIPYQLYDGTYQGRPMVYAKNLYGRDGIYFHTGSGWGVYNCFSYDPVTGDGVVVLTNGASSGGTNSYGIYYVCSDINNYIYQLIQ